MIVLLQHSRIKSPFRTVFIEIGDKNGDLLLSETMGLPGCWFNFLQGFKILLSNFVISGIDLRSNL